MVYWSHKRQNVISHSASGAEYVADNSTASMIGWFKTIVEEPDKQETQVAFTLEDRTGCHSNEKGEGRILRSKYVGLRYHNLRQKVKSRKIKPSSTPTEKKLADLLTQVLAPGRFDQLIKRVVSKFDDDVEK